MFEKLYRVTGDRPTEDIDRLLTSLRADARYDVTLGTPPFQRDRSHQITAVRLRFTPRAAASKPAYAHAAEAAQPHS